MKLNINIEENFWTLNNELKLIPVFKDLYEKDKSKDKNESSKLMWGFHLVYDYESKFHDLTLKEREQVVSKEYFKDPKFKFSKYSVEIEEFQRLFISAAKRYMIDWENMMDERKEFMATKEWSDETWEMLDKMHIASPKLYSEMKRIQEMLEKDVQDGEVKGDRTESASEKGLI